MSSERDERNIRMVRRGSGDGMYERRDLTQHGKPQRREESQPEAREGRIGPYGVTDRLAVPEKPGNSGGGKGPEFKVKVQSARIGD
jgi:hypothetical protein